MVPTISYIDDRHQMFVNMVRESVTGTASCQAVTESGPAPAAFQNLVPSEVQKQEIAESSPPSTTAHGKEGVATVSQESGDEDGFGERVVGREALIEFEHKVVARLECEEGRQEPVLSMDPLLKGKLSFPIEGLMLSVERAKRLLVGHMS